MTSLTPTAGPPPAADGAEQPVTAAASPAPPADPVGSPAGEADGPRPGGPRPGGGATRPRLRALALRAPARLWRGRPEDPRWVRPAVLALVTATAVLYLWGLGASGWANSFYSAAVQAGTESWTAFFFGSSDAAGSITVDKTPASLWVMELSARLFGLSSWSLLVPQALEGAATVAVLYAAVRRRLGPGAGLLAGAALALTPVAALMFRFNNPDALLVLLLTCAAYAVLRAVEAGRTGWLVLAGALIGVAFLTKMLQAFVVLPAFALAYLVAGPPRLGRRIGQLLLAGLAVVASAGWWVAVVELTPAQYRPYIGGSRGNSVLELALGYNGLGRLNGTESGAATAGWSGASALWGGETGPTRLFGVQLGGQIAWLLPAALVALAVGVWLTRRAPRTDPLRAALLVWGGWLLTTAVLFSYMAGIFHAYYTVALAPAVAALVGCGTALLWRRRHHPVAAGVLGGTALLTVVWSAVLLGRVPDWQPWLGVVVPAVGVPAALLLVAGGRLPAPVGRGAAVAALLAVLAGPAGYTLVTVAEPHTGSMPTAGPAVVAAAPAGGWPGAAGGGAPGGGAGGPAARDFGWLVTGSEPNTQVTELLSADSDAYTWVAATVGSNSASGYQLATGEPVMAVGGFNGTDPSPTLEQFQRLVLAGEIHYFIAGGWSMPMGSGESASQQITDWVVGNYTAHTVQGTTLYDLTRPAADTTH
ncbi:ArnT family glycosyltransferase [Allostreptomyces psammosilenae]|uniref:4-amino-4-deoxy-L-arabinose transferase-like glycosyltransferase n=1 Tax=Allostreptomyces psammosilenae TaxID=1892865 RepID=A0A852ZUF7_9ACTN|nr:glycosyltransferase family 39 protein [Allostreptomyces psammosilenae]NYI04920.1 4-amino-4-deoxy-L-arabinose transferase-like glycosyltransferase [Allostreptomyces psammosilenae]